MVTEIRRRASNQSTGVLKHGFQVSNTWLLLYTPEFNIFVDDAGLEISEIVRKSAFV